MRWAVYTWEREKKVVSYTINLSGKGTNTKYEDEPIVFNVVSSRDAEEQKQRAIEYKDYLNMQEEAKERAVKDITLVTAVAKRMAP